MSGVYAEGYKEDETNQAGTICESEEGRMITEEQEKLIEEKKAEIERLRKEIKQIRGSKLKELVEAEMYYYVPFGNKFRKDKKFTGSKEWDHIRRICMEIHRPQHIGENLTVDTLTEEEKVISAAMAEEIIRIWNKYFVAVNTEILK